MTSQVPVSVAGALASQVPVSVAGALRTSQVPVSVAGALTTSQVPRGALLVAAARRAFSLEYESEVPLVARIPSGIGASSLENVGVSSMSIRVAFRDEHVFGAE